MMTFLFLISSSLGSLETTLLKITSAYSSIANGGYMIKPRLIDVIYDNAGKIIFKGDKRSCQDCSFETNEQLTQTFIENLPFPDINHDNEIFYSKRVCISDDFISNGCH